MFLHYLPARHLVLSHVSDKRGRHQVMLTGPSDMGDLTYEIKNPLRGFLSGYLDYISPGNMTTIFPSKVAISLNCP